MKRIIALFTGLFIFLSVSVKADEGMWLLPLLKKLNMDKMTELGLKLSAEDIYSINNSSLKDAIVIFGGGCTGEIISDKGLLITNHHCGYASIQGHSSVDHDYLKDGFWAKSISEELPTPGLAVTFLVSIEDVSKQVNSQLNDNMSEADRAAKIREISTSIATKAKGNTHYTSTVRPIFSGNQFYLFVYETFTDVRFVGAPPSSIGKYGADTDNWMWPRHTGDFSMFRVYMSPDGKPANYSDNNVPYKPKHYLPISNKPLEKGDFAMILGYPGGTTRYMTSFGIDNELIVTHPNRIKIRGIRQDIILEDMLADPKVKIQYANKYSGSTNYWKFSIGQKAGLERLNIKGKKQKMEKKFTNWVNQNSRRKAKYGNALKTIEESLLAIRAHNSANQYYGECFNNVEIISFANRASRLYNALKNTPKDEEKINAAVEGFKRGIPGFFKNYNAPTDIKVTAALFKLFYDDVPREFYPDILFKIEKKFKGDFEAYADYLFKKSVFGSEEKINAFLEKPSLKVLEKDPAFVAGQSFAPKRQEIRAFSNKFNTDLAKARRLYIGGILEMEKDAVLYPDANFTMRLTYGTVGDYEPRDAVIYKHYTTMKGIVEKEDPNNWEFVVPPKLKKLYETKDFGSYATNGEMRVCFTTNNDITGGNSGSPVINGNGELLGLAFDGNWEAMSGDIAFETELQRCINVDIRYVLFIID
ncbi:S46 family peptidase, partial [Bacteroidota bacterium]